MRNTFTKDSSITATMDFMISSPDGVTMELKITKEKTYEAGKQYQVLYDTKLKNELTKPIAFEIQWDQIYPRNEVATFQPGQSIFFLLNKMTVKYTGAMAADLKVKKSPNYFNITNTMVLFH